MKKVIGMVGAGLFFCMGLSTVESNAVAQVREKPACNKNKSQVKETDQDDPRSVDEFCDQGLSNGFFVFGLGEVTF